MSKKKELNHDKRDFFDLGGTLFSYKECPGTTFPILVEAIGVREPSAKIIK